jgi:Uma2 family endonuclease
MATATLVSFEEFMALPRTPGIKRERIDGEVVEVESGKRFHENPKVLIAEFLILAFGRNSRWIVVPETQFQLDPDTDLFPDVGIALRERLLKSRDDYYQGSPEVAIEVVSSESASHLRRKLKKYFRTGTAEAWVLYSSDQTLVVHRADGSVREYGAEETFAPEMFPGIEIRVAELFIGALGA